MTPAYAKNWIIPDLIGSAFSNHLTGCSPYPLADRL
jgi:hypothetical protein